MQFEITGVPRTALVYLCPLYILTKYYMGIVCVCVLNIHYTQEETEEKMSCHAKHPCKFSFTQELTFHSCQLFLTVRNRFRLIPSFANHHGQSINPSLENLLEKHPLPLSQVCTNTFKNWSQLVITSLPALINHHFCNQIPLASSSYFFTILH